jgi:catechol 2,3-dioxygenase-like lactoylglutathione lyase family enzyme
VIPSIRVADVAAAVAFYVDVLGFEVVRGEPADGNVAVARRDERVMLEAGGDFYSQPYNEAIRERIGARSPHALYLEEPELDGLHERVRAAGVPIVDPLAERPWGQREFTLEDPEGNWLTFWTAS